MTRFFQIVFAFCLFLSAANAQKQITTKMDSVSYSVGMFVSQSLKQQNITEIDRDAFFAAMDDVFKGNTTKITQQQASAILQKHAQEQSEKMNEGNIKVGQEFLAKNKTRPGVTTLPSGLQYEVIKDGTGLSPKATDKVRTHYHGTTVDGSVFDSSVQRNEPIDFPVNGVIKGWTEALQLMKEGAKWKLFIPADLAYGAMSPSPSIKPHSTLIFEVELIKVNP